MEEFFVYHILSESKNFTNNIVYVFLFACVAILNYGVFSKAQKVALIYISTLCARIFIPIGTMLTIAILLVSMFLVEEYLNPDQDKIHIVHNWHAKVGDFIYSFFFMDAGGWMLLTIAAMSATWISFVKNVLNRFAEKCVFAGTVAEKVGGMEQIYPWVVILLAFVCAWRTMHALIAPKFIVKEYKEINRYFAKYISYDLNLESDEAHRRLCLLTELEDRSYFIRENSYNWFSPEFFRYKWNGFQQKENRKSFQRFWRRLKKAASWIKKNGLPLAVKRANQMLRIFFYKLKWSWKSLWRRIRGGSTLEMQLIRQIGIEEGYNYVGARKIFEFAFTFLFFPQLKKLYERKIVSKRDCFKDFLLYVYIQSVRVKINGVWFTSIAQLMENIHGEAQEKKHMLRLEEYDITELYVAYLALTGANVTDKRLILYPEVIDRYEIDLDYAKWFSNQIKERSIQPGDILRHEELENNYKKYAEQRKPQERFYRIGYAILPFAENNIYYGAPDWPSYGEYECWNFAQTVYGKIWHDGFNSYAGTPDDMLRYVPEGKVRSITADNTKRFLSNAPRGAVIRLSDRLQGLDTSGTQYHSQILLDKDENGITVYQSDNYETSITYYTWEEYADEYGRYTYFKYVKYPVAEG